MARRRPSTLRRADAWLQLLSQAVEGALADTRTWPEEGRDVALAFDAALSGARCACGALPAPPDAGTWQTAADPCVLLLEDLRTMQARLRQEKLAAMGRVSAGIAHEIRNPLAAISQANALLPKSWAPRSNAWRASWPTTWSGSSASSTT
jgi:two-component system sensor histidine kinase PilS (NtrC family)